jgi:hypothetical protein
MGAKEIQKKIKKNGKLVHGVMIFDVVPRKNTKHGIPRFHRKTLHKKCHQGGLHLAFYPIELGLCKFYSKLSNLDPILAVMCIFPLPTTFVTRVF